MKMNRKSIAAGLAVGVLAGGAGGAIAATTSGTGSHWQTRGPNWDAGPGWRGSSAGTRWSAGGPWRSGSRWPNGTSGSMAGGNW